MIKWLIKIYIDKDTPFVRASNLSRQSIYLLVLYPVTLSMSRTQGHHPAPALDRRSAASADVDWSRHCRCRRRRDVASRFVTSRHVTSRRADDGDWLERTRQYGHQRTLKVMCNARAARCYEPPRVRTSHRQHLSTSIMTPAPTDARRAMHRLCIICAFSPFVRSRIIKTDGETFKFVEIITSLL